MQVFSSDVQNKVLEAAKLDNGISTLADKQLKQLVMPFAKFKIEEVAKGGAQVRPVLIIFVIFLHKASLMRGRQGRAVYRCDCLSTQTPLQSTHHPPCRVSACTPLPYPQGLRVLVA